MSDSTPEYPQDAPPVTSPAIGKDEWVARHYDRRLPKYWMTAAPTASSARDFEAHAAPFGKFESVGQEVFQDLLQSLGVRHQTFAQTWIDFDLER